jgi:D-alanyl-D-alanine-carboxypeptidase/D-alanyl-D-alanine-endopeptidase
MKAIAFTVAALAAACSASSSSDPGSTTDADVQRALAGRYAGDRTATCVAAAVIEGDAVHRASLCADPAHARATDGAFEIGSVSKTMTASLLADLIDRGKITLDDPLTKYLPAGTTVPTFQGAPILIKHLVTHTAGLPSLPSRFAPADPTDPYADLDPATLLASLADVTLPQAPGAKWAYSNFGFMVLSYIVSQLDGSDYEPAVHARLFTPLHMDHAYIDHAPAGVTAMAGHRSTGEVTPAWHFTPELPGVGGVRATLDDMIRYAQAELGQGDAHTVDVLARTHAVVDLGMPRPTGDPEMGMAWVRLPLDGRTILGHDGGTGGFTSFVAIDPDADRAVVLLADTELANVGGLGNLTEHLLDPTVALEPPRTIATPSATLLAALAGHYQVAGIDVTLHADAGALVAVLADGSEITLAYDSHGDFFTHDIDAVFTPMLDASGQQTFALVQGGEPILATRLATATP